LPFPLFRNPDGEGHTINRRESPQPDIGPLWAAIDGGALAAPPVC